MFDWFRKYGTLVTLLCVLVLTGGLYVAGFSAIAYWLLGAVSVLATIPLIVSMIRSLTQHKFGIDVLAVTAILSALALGEYLAALVVLIMLAAGSALEVFAQERAKSELNALTRRAPRRAHIRRHDQILDLPVSEVVVGDTVIIKPGDIVPVDGVVLVGISEFDESALTGESLPVQHGPGSHLLSGSINTAELVEIRATAASADSQYEQIIALVREASSSRSPLIRLADSYAVGFTVLSLSLAGLAWLFSGDPMRFLEVLVVATPCPLLIATPVALVSGMSRAAKHGIIMKNGGALERLSRINAIAFDKTGTLTKGVPEVLDIQPASGMSSQLLLEMAASLEQGSTHILAQAVSTAAEHHGIKPLKVTHLKETPGAGLRGIVGGDEVIAGRATFLQDHGIRSVHDLKVMATHIAINGTYAGYISFSDQLRSETPATLKTLKSMGIKRVIMLTGDHLSVAQNIAKQAGIATIHSDLLPPDKVKQVNHYKQHSGPIAMIGDGINDAPTLAAADVGIALGAKGSTVASESADIVIMLDDLSRVPLAIKIARRTMMIARQSIRIGIGLSILLMLIAAAGFIQPVPGAIMQEGVDALVIINALRAHRGARKYL